MFPAIAGLFASSVGAEVRGHTVVAMAVWRLFWVVLIFVVRITSEHFLVLSYLHPKYVCSVLRYGGLVSEGMLVMGGYEVSEEL